MNPTQLHERLRAVNEAARRRGRTPELLHELITLAILWSQLPRAVRATVERGV
jgi:hypothetical protein